MREIKFRAWDKKNKIMFNEIQNIYDGGDFFDNENNKLDIYGSSLNSESFGFNLDNEGIEIMQYTGLKDKNGKEIYEGDIVRYFEGFIEEVKWNNYLCGFTPFVSYEDGLEPEYLEVIGNIYEPELLESEK